MLEYGLGKLLSSQKVKNEKKITSHAQSDPKTSFITLSFHFQNSVNRLNQDHKTFLVSLLPCVIVV